MGQHLLAKQVLAAQNIGLRERAPDIRDIHVARGDLCESEQCRSVQDGQQVVHGQAQALSQLWDVLVPTLRDQ